eukprot:tig00021532_g22198.t1
MAGVLAPPAGSGPPVRPIVVFAWTLNWLLANMATTILNKAVFHERFGGWKFPLTLSAVHLAVQALFTLLYVRLAGLVERRHVDSRGRALLLLFSVLFAANIVFGNAGLRYVTVSFSQICRALVPSVTVLLSRLVLGKTYPLRVKLSLVPILAGVCLAAYGEIAFHALGFALMMATVLLASLKAIYSNKFLTGAYRLHPLDLLERAALPSLLLLLPAIAASGEAARLARLGPPPPSAALYVALSAGASLWLNYASFRYNQVTSALSITVAGNAKEALTIVVSLLIFRNPVSPLNALGTALAIAGSALYSALQYREATRSVAAAAAAGRKAGQEAAPPAESAEPAGAKPAAGEPGPQPKSGPGPGPAGAPPGPRRLRPPA